MANSFVTLKSIARETLPRLVENLVMPELVYRDYSEDYSDLGNTIQVRKPTVLEAKDFTAGSSVTFQDVTEQSVDVTLDKIATVDIKIGAFEAALNWSDEKFRKDFIEPAAVALAEKINKAGVEMYTQIPNMIGTAGTTPSAMTDFSAARKFLNKAKAPMTDRVAIWDVDADAKFTELSNLFKANESASTETLREGQIGRVYGMDNYMTQAIEGHTSAAAGTILTNGTGSKGDTELVVDGITTAITVGDIFTLAGDTTKYTVAAATDLSSGEQTLTIVPALKADVADGVAVTVSSTKTVNNLVFHRNAIAFVTRPLLAPAGAADAYTTSNGQYSLRIVRAYDPTYKTETMSMDVLYAYKVIYPELAARYLG